jgi:hypothetical protein
MVRQAHHERLDLPLVLSSSKDALRSKPYGGSKFKVQEFKVLFRSIQRDKTGLTAHTKSVQMSFIPGGVRCFWFKVFFNCEPNIGNVKAGPAEFAGQNGRTQPGNQLALFGLGLQTKTVSSVTAKRGSFGFGL